MIPWDGPTVVRERENTMRGIKAMILLSVLIGLPAGSNSQVTAPLKLVHSIELPDLKDGDFDHFAVDLAGNRLFVTAEDNSKVVVFDLKTNKAIKTISDLKAPHSMLVRPDLQKLFVVDSDLGEVKIYNTETYQPAGSIKVREGADSSGYDPLTKYLYVVDGGKDAKLPNAYLEILDTNTSKKVGEIEIDSDDVEAMAFDKDSPRMFVDIRGKSAVEVIDRAKRAIVATWPIAGAQGLTTIAFNAAAHRLYVGSRSAKLYILDSDSGKTITSLAAPAMVDDAPFDGKKRIYFAGTLFTDVFEIKDENHLQRIAHIPTAFRAKTAILVPELNRFYLAVPRHGGKPAAIRVYETVL